MKLVLTVWRDILTVQAVFQVTLRCIVKYKNIVCLLSILYHIMIFFFLTALMLVNMNFLMYDFCCTALEVTCKVSLNIFGFSLDL